MNEPTDPHLGDVGVLYQAERYDRALIVAEKALTLAEAAFGPDHLNVPTSAEEVGHEVHRGEYVHEGDYRPECAYDGSRGRWRRHHR